MTRASRVDFPDSQVSRLGWELNPVSILLTINHVICQPSGSHEPINSSGYTLNLIGCVSPENLVAPAVMRTYMLLCDVMYRDLKTLLVS